ncbi:phage head-tail joining protein [Falsihalocynthiibacter sp. CO-5D18]|uniref:phage head-tail joining protein n=1 Tax=Falsihalocynthiibacter sp. CO-5D18 TaxID=3240872 RepID=UPI0035105AD5
MALFTQADLQNITKAIASGVLTATIHGEAVQYRNLAEMIKIKNMIEADLAPAGSTRLGFSTPVAGRGV